LVPRLEEDSSSFSPGPRRYRPAHRSSEQLPYHCCRHRQPILKCPCGARGNHFEANDSKEDDESKHFIGPSPINSKFTDGPALSGPLFKLPVRQKPVGETSWIKLFQLRNLLPTFRYRSGQFCSTSAFGLGSAMTQPCPANSLVQKISVSFGSCVHNSPLIRASATIPAHFPRPVVSGLMPEFAESRCRESCTSGPGS